MNSFSDMVWIETRKAVRSRMLLWTALGSMFMPLGVAFLIFVAKNPEFSQKLGLISAKANLMAYSTTDWTSYLVLFTEMVSAGGFFFFVLTTTWIFGREFADGTLKDMLAVPVPRASILLAKFSVASGWSVVIAILMFTFGLLVGALLRLPGGSLDIILRGSGVAAVTACLVIAVIPPFAFFASLGRGYLLPMAVAVLTLITANLMMVIGWAEYFPWAVPLLVAQGEASLKPISYSLPFLTGLAGMAATYLWWKYADQSR